MAKPKAGKTAKAKPKPPIWAADLIRIVNSSRAKPSSRETLVTEEWVEILPRGKAA